MKYLTCTTAIQIRAPRGRALQACAIPQTAGYGGRLIAVPPNDSCMPLTIVFAGGMTITILGELPVTVAQAGTLSASATGSFDDPQILEIVDDPSRDSVNEDACLLRSSLLMERFCGTIPTSQHTNDDRLPLPNVAGGLQDASAPFNAIHTGHPLGSKPHGCGTPAGGPAPKDTGRPYTGRRGIHRVGTASSTRARGKIHLP